MHTWWKLKMVSVIFKVSWFRIKKPAFQCEKFQRCLIMEKRYCLQFCMKRKKNLFYWFWKRKNLKTRLHCEIVNTVNNGTGFPSYWVLGFLYILQRPGTILKLSRSDLSSSWMEEIFSEWMPNFCPQWALYRGVCCGFAWPQDKTGTWQGTVYRYSFRCGVICLRQKIQLPFIFYKLLWSIQWSIPCCDFVLVVYVD